MEVSLPFSVLKLQPGKEVHDGRIVRAILPSQEMFRPASVLTSAPAVHSRQEAGHGLHEDVRQVHCLRTSQVQPGEHELLEFVLEEVVAREGPLVWSNGEEERREAELLLHVRSPACQVFQY